jgi:hypothetical protein
VDPNLQNIVKESGFSPQIFGNSPLPRPQSNQNRVSFPTRPTSTSTQPRNPSTSSQPRNPSKSPF